MRLFDADARRLVQTVAGGFGVARAALEVAADGSAAPASAVAAGAAAREGRAVWTGHSDGRVRVWAAETAALRGELRVGAGARDAVLALALVDGAVWAGTCSGSVWLLDPAGRAPPRALGEGADGARVAGARVDGAVAGRHEGAVRCMLQVLPTYLGRALPSGPAASPAALLPRPPPLSRPQPHRAARRAPQVGPEVWTGSGAGELFVWARAPGAESGAEGGAQWKLARALPRVAGGVSALLRLPDGAVLVGHKVHRQASALAARAALAGRVPRAPRPLDGGLHVLSAAGEHLWSAAGARGVRCAVLAGGVVWSGHSDGRFRLWTVQPQGLELFRAMRAHRTAVLALVRDAVSVWSCTKHGTLREWSIALLLAASPDHPLARPFSPPRPGGAARRASGAARGRGPLGSPELLLSISEVVCPEDAFAPAAPPPPPPLAAALPGGPGGPSRAAWWRLARAWAVGAARRLRGLGGGGGGEGR